MTKNISYFRILFALILFNASIQLSLAQLTLEDSLVAYYPFNGNANDETGNGNDGTVIGATLISDRNLNPNSAYNFDGMDDRIELPNNFDFRNRSIVTWFYPRSVINTSLYIYQSDGITVQYGSSAIAVIVRDSANNVILSAGGGPTAILAQIALDNWYMASLVVNEDTNYYYLNDSLIGVKASATLSAPFSWPGSRLGCRGDDNFFFDGIIDDVLIYNRSLSSSEIESIYSGSTILNTESEIESLEAKVYPNPFSDYIEIILSLNTVSSNFELASLEGKNILNGAFSGNHNKIELSNLKNGVYILRIISKDKIRNFKISKK